MLIMLKGKEIPQEGVNEDCRKGVIHPDDYQVQTVFSKSYKPQPSDEKI